MLEGQGSRNLVRLVYMKVLIVGEHEGSLGGALESAGVDVERPPAGSFGAQGGDQVGELAAALIAFERLFGDDAPDAVLLVSASNLALAAVLVATKLQIPVAASVEAEPAEDATADMNRRLIARLADGMVAGDAATIADSLRGLIAS
jgi:UDP-N-acetylglucosamine 2-epimerase